MIRGKGPLVLALLFVLPAIAHSPAWLEERLLGPDDGTFLHYPLRAEAWRALRRGELPGWNPAVFGGTPLLAAYRAGALYPLMPVLSPLPPFLAFQLLVLFSLGAAGVLSFLYLRRLRAHAVGAYVGALGFALGPYLVDHLGDTATVVASPLLPLALLAAEAHADKASARRAAGLAASLALLFLAGSPEAARAGLALVLGRLVLLHARPRPGAPRPVLSVLAVLLGALLAAPQLLPTLLALQEAGRGSTGLTREASRSLPGATGLVLQYVSHTPAPAFALAAVPLAFTRRSARALLLALLLCVALRYGRGPLAAPGSLALAFDFTLALLGGLSNGVQWEERRAPLGRRLRAWTLFAGLAGAAALSVAAANLGPLPQGLAGAVGVLAVGFILYIAAAGARDEVAAAAFLLPLTAGLVLQPHGRDLWSASPTRRELVFGTPAREAVDRALGRWRGERMLTLAREWPREAALDLAFGNLACVSGRSSANGYDPLVPRRLREALPGMDAGGLLPGAFFRTSPVRLEQLGIRLVQAPADALVVPADAQGLGEPLDLALEAGRPRLLPVPSGFATQLRLATWMADAVGLPQGEVVSEAAVRLASGRELVFPLRAGIETGEWAHDRADVRARVRHARPPLQSSFRPAGQDFEGHRYLAVLDLQGRYRIDGLRLERRRGPGRLYLHRAGLADGARASGVSLVSAYLSETRALREIKAAPTLRLYAVRGSTGLARVVDQVRLLSSDGAAREVLHEDARFDPRREAVLDPAAAKRLGLPLPIPGARAGRAEIVRLEGGRIEVRAEGPGLLVLNSSFDPGWSASVDGEPAAVVPVNGVQTGLGLAPGPHRVRLRHAPRGLRTGIVLALLAAAAVGGALALERRVRLTLSGRAC
jgi:hypothetical protein